MCKKCKAALQKTLQAAWDKENTDARETQDAFDWVVWRSRRSGIEQAAVNLGIKLDMSSSF